MKKAERPEIVERIARLGQTDLDRIEDAWQHTVEALKDGECIHGNNLATRAECRRVAVEIADSTDPTPSLRGRNEELLSENHSLRQMLRRLVGQEDLGPWM